MPSDDYTAQDEIRFLQTQFTKVATQSTGHMSEAGLALYCRRIIANQRTWSRGVNQSLVVAAAREILHQLQELKSGKGVN